MATPHQQETLLDRYAVAEELGLGRYGRTVLATDSKTCHPCTLKYIHAQLCESTSTILNSYLRVKHPNILRHLAFVANHRRSATGVADTTVIVSEFAGFGSLRRELMRRYGMLLESTGSTREVFGAAASDASGDFGYSPLSSAYCTSHGPSSRSSCTTAEPTNPFENSSPGAYFSIVDIWFIAIQLFLGLRHLHKQKEPHRDITTQNVFITQPDHVIKLGHCHAFDFPVNLPLPPPELSASASAGMSPRNGAVYSTTKVWKEPADIWALGCVLFEVLTLRPISVHWEEVLRDQLMRYLSPESIRQFQSILRACLQPDAAARATVSSLLSMREVLEGYQLLVNSRELGGESSKLRHVAYYWEKSACKKLKATMPAPTAPDFVPRPEYAAVLGRPPVLSAHGGDKGLKLLDRMRSGRAWKVPALGSGFGASNTSTTSTNKVLVPPATEFRLLSRSSIRRSLSQEAKDKFSRPAALPVRHHPGNTTARSARGTHKFETAYLLPQDTKGYRQTIAPEGGTQPVGPRGYRKRPNGLSDMLLLAAGSSPSTGEGLASSSSSVCRETTPATGGSRPGVLTRKVVTQKDGLLEVTLPREDRVSIWREVQSRAKDYAAMEAILADCLDTLESFAGASGALDSEADSVIGSGLLQQDSSPILIESPPPLTQRRALFPNHKVSVETGLKSLRPAHSNEAGRFTKSVQRVFDLVRVISADGSRIADCRRTIDRVSLFQAPSRTPSNPTPTNAQRYRSASQEHH